MRKEYEFKLVHPIRSAIKHYFYKCLLFITEPFPKINHKLIEKREQDFLHWLDQEEE